MSNRVYRVNDAAEAIRAVLEDRTVLLADGIQQGRVHPGWCGPIAWELAEAAVDALDAIWARGTNPNARGETGCRVCDCTIYRHQDGHGELLDGCKCGHIDLAHSNEGLADGGRE